MAFLDEGGGIRLSNGTIDVVAAKTIGPRLLRCGFLGGANLLGEYPERATTTTLGTWRPRGGHRLWVAPEEMPGSYAPDNDPVAWDLVDDRHVILRQTRDAADIEKTMTVRVAAADASLIIDHEICNRGHWPIEVAPWALTVLAPDGVAVLPQPLFRSHDEELRPVRGMALWSFTDLSDPRWRLGKRLITLTPHPDRPAPQKIGICNERGWSACIWPHAVLVKQCAHMVGAQYPDFGSNTEVYVEGRYLELETLGRLERLEPGACAVHTERWSLFPAFDAEIVADEEQLHDALVGLITATLTAELPRG